MLKRLGSTPREEGEVDLHFEVVIPAYRPFLFVVSIDDGLNGDPTLPDFIRFDLGPSKMVFDTAGASADGRQRTSPDRLPSRCHKRPGCVVSMVRVDSEIRRVKSCGCSLQAG